MLGAFIKGHIHEYQLKDGGNRWAVVVYQGKRVASNGRSQDFYSWKRGFKSKKSAHGELKKILKTMRDGSNEQSPQLNVKEYLGRWLNTIEANVAPKTFERYKQMVELNINPKLGAIRLVELRPIQIAEFYTWATAKGNLRTKAGLSTRTVLHIHRLLRQALQQALLWQLTLTNPIDAVKAPRANDVEMKPVGEARAGGLLRSAAGTEMFLPILTALCTGMRRGEILAVRWNDLDLKDARLTVNQSVCQTRQRGVFFKPPKKRYSRRTITLPAVLVAAIRQQQNSQQKQKDLLGPEYWDLDLVIALPDGNPWAPDRFTDAFGAFVRRSKVRGIRFHDLRHTHASELLRRGIPLKTVSARLGHSNATVTLNTYAHLMSGDDEQAAELVEELYKNELID